MKIPIVINGGPCTGKDTLVRMVRDHFKTRNLPVYNISSVDKVKEAARILGWDGEKDGKGRQFLSNLKDLSTCTYDGPLNYMLDYLGKLPEGIFFFHIREPMEIAKFVAHTGAWTLQLTRKSGAEVHINHADSNTHLYEYDFHIRNDGTLEELEHHTMITLFDIIRRYPSGQAAV